MSKNDELREMFTYVGRGRWINASTTWKSEELATLYYCLWTTLDNTDNVDIRHDIVWLMEKFFNESESNDPVKEIWNSED